MRHALTLKTLPHLFRFGGIDNHPYRIVVGDIVPQPVEKHHELVAYAEYRAQMDNEPQHPRKETLRMELAYLCHSLVSSHRCHRPEVIIYERSQRRIVARRNLPYVVREVLRLLYGNLRELRMTFRISRIGGLKTLVADGEHAVHALHAVILVHDDTLSASEMITVHSGDGVGPDTRHPDERTGRYLRSVFHHNLMVVVVGHHLAQTNLNAHALEKLLSLLRRVMRHAGKQSVACLYQIDVHQRRVHVRIVVRQHVAFHLRQSARNLHARGTATHNHHVEQLLTLLLSGAGQRTLQIAQQGVAQSHSLGNGLHRHGLIGYIAVSEEVARRAGGKDKIVILHLSD